LIEQFGGKMRALILLIIVIPLLVTTASAMEKNLFFCQDTFGNLTGEKRDFVLSVGIEKIKMSFINKGEQISPTAEQKIVFKNDRSLVAVNSDLYSGVLTFSLHEGTNSVWKAVRTYVESETSLAQHSDCFLQ